MYTRPGSGTGPWGGAVAAAARVAYLLHGVVAYVVIKLAPGVRQAARQSWERESVRLGLERVCAWGLGRLEGGMTATLEGSG